MNTVVWLAALVVAAPIVKVKPVPAGDVVGEWRVESTTIGGRQTKSPVPLVYTFTKDGKWLVHRDGEPLAPTLQRGYEVDPKAGPPTFDLITNTAAVNGARFRGIFKLDGDTLTLCGTRARDAARPTAFESAEGSGHTLYVLKRVKKPE